jgi:superfamily II DNA or RNA helicase
MASTIDKQVENMSVSLIGARKGETIKGYRSNNRDVLLRVTTDIAPSRKFLTELRKTSKYDSFLSKLAVIPFYRNMTKEERSIYLSSTQNSETYILGHNLEILGCGKDISQISTLSDDRWSALTNMMENDPVVPMESLKALFIEQHNEESMDKAYRDIFFELTAWTVDTSYTLNSIYEGLIMDIDNCNTIHAQFDISTKPTDRNLAGAYTFQLGDAEPIAFIADEDCNKITKWSLQQLPDLLDELEIVFTEEEIELIFESLSIYGASGLKSVLQKCIRYGASRVSISFDPRTMKVCDRLIDMSLFSTVAWYMLFVCEGSFNPNIQRFVRGRESAFKRLAVSIAEDSHLANIKDITRFVSYAWLMQKVPDYKIPKHGVLTAMRAVVEACQTTYKFAVEDYREFEQHQIPDFDEGMTPTAIASKVISICGSFGSDIQLFQSMYESDGKAHVYRNTRPASMELEHAIDHHCFPELVYFTNIEWFTKHRSMTSRVAENIFDIMWKKLSCINYRINKFVDWEDEDVKALRTARARFVRARHILADKASQGMDSSNDESPSEEPQSEVILKTVLSESWMAGMVGSLTGSQHLKWVATLRPDDSDSFIFVRKVARNDRNPSPTLESAELEVANMELQEKFAKGVRASSVPIAWMKKATIHRTGDDWIISAARQNAFWSDAKHVTLKYPRISVVSPARNQYSFSYIGKKGFADQPDAMPALSSLYDIKEFARAAALIFSDFTEIKLPSISRDGGGTKLKVTAYDVGAYQIIHQLVRMYPSVLKVKDKLTFDVIDPVGLTFLRKFMGDELNRLRHASTGDEEEGAWGPIKDKQNRTLYKYQTKAVNALSDNYNQGKKGSFIWLTVGSGKSLIVLSFLKQLIEEDRMPKYVLYTLPAGALQSLCDEIDALGFEVILLSPVIRPPNKIIVKGVEIKCIRDVKHIKPYTVTIVIHDHLRIVDDLIMPIMPETYFIVDEVHKAVSDTLRTSTMLNCALLSQSFCAMTGTPTLDGKTTSLIPWLRMISDSPITSRNHLAAINSMISDCINVGVNVEEFVEEVEMIAEMVPKYQKHLPRKLGGSNDAFGKGDLVASLDYCYASCDEHIIKCAIENRARGVFIVARDAAHQARLNSAMIAEGEEAFLITGKTSINHTDRSVEEGAKDWRFVITTKQYSEGYTLTRLSMMLWSPYFSNQASRTQMLGRICRVGQKSASVKYVTYVCGLLERFREKYQHAKNIESMLSSLVD